MHQRTRPVSHTLEGGGITGFFFVGKVCLIVVPWPLRVVVVVFLALVTQPPLPGVCVPLRSAGYATHTESLWRCTISTPRLVARSDLRAWGEIEKGRRIFTIHPRGREQLKKTPKKPRHRGRNQPERHGLFCVPHSLVCACASFLLHGSLATSWWWSSSSPSLLLLVVLVPLAENLSAMHVVVGWHLAYVCVRVIGNSPLSWRTDVNK